MQRFLPLARHLSRRYGTRGQDDDLEQVAALALLKAIDRFDPARGTSFSSFAVPTILGDLKRYFRDQGWMVRVPRRLQELEHRVSAAATELGARFGRAPTAAELAAHCGVAVDDVVELQTVATAHRPASLDGEPVTVLSEDRGYQRIEDAAEIDRLLLGVSRRDELILRLRFQAELTQSEIGARLGLSQVTVSRIIHRSIATLQAQSTMASAPS